MSSVFQVNPLDYTTPKGVDINDIKPLDHFMRVEDAAQIGRGLWYGTAVGGAQLVGMGAAGALSLTDMQTFGVFGESLSSAQDNIFDQVQSNREYWGQWYKSSEPRSMAGQILRGLGEFTGHLALGGAVGAGVVGGMDTTLTEIEKGKTAGEASALGALRGGFDAASVLMPFSLPLLRGSGALSSVAQRLGYGVGSNVALGVGQRVSEQQLLSGMGYEAEAAAKQPFDTSAIAVDAILGAAFGSFASVLDARAAKKSAVELKQETATALPEATTATAVAADAPVMQQAAMQGDLSLRLEGDISAKLDALRQAAEARPFSRGEAKKFDAELQSLQHQRNSLEPPSGEVVRSDVKDRAAEIHAADPKMPARKALQQAEKEAGAALKEQANLHQQKLNDIDAKIQDVQTTLATYRKAKDAEADLSRISQKLKTARTAEERAAAAGFDTPETKALLEGIKAEEAAAVLKFRDNLTVEQVDAAMVENLKLIGDDMAMGVPQTPSALGAHRTQMAEMANALDSGRAPNMDAAINAKFTPDPRIAERQAAKNAAARSMLPKEVQDVKLSEATDPLSSGGFRSGVLTPDQLHASMQAKMEAALNGLRPDAMLLDADGNRVTVQEIKQQHAADVAKAEDEADTVASMFSCLLKF